MRWVDALPLIALVIVLVALILVIARQRYMLRSPGGIAIAMARGNRWLYGIGRYDGDELRWYRAWGIGTRPSRVWRRESLAVLSRRAPGESELSALPASAMVVRCRDEHAAAIESEFALAFADGAYTGFISWLESASPHSV